VSSIFGDIKQHWLALHFRHSPKRRLTISISYTIKNPRWGLQLSKMSLMAVIGERQVTVGNEWLVGDGCGLIAN